LSEVFGGQAQALKTITSKTALAIKPMAGAVKTTANRVLHIHPDGEVDSGGSSLRAIRTLTVGKIVVAK
jgi:hypothetical protein